MGGAIVSRREKEFGKEHSNFLVSNRYGCSMANI